MPPSRPGALVPRSDGRTLARPGAQRRGEPVVLPPALSSAGVAGERPKTRSRHGPLGSALTPPPDGIGRRRTVTAAARGVAVGRDGEAPRRSTRATSTAAEALTRCEAGVVVVAGSPGARVPFDTRPPPSVAGPGPWARREPVTRACVLTRSALAVTRSQVALRDAPRPRAPTRGGVSARRAVPVTGPVPAVA